MHKRKYCHSFIAPMLCRCCHLQLIKDYTIIKWQLITSLCTFLQISSMPTKCIKVEFHSIKKALEWANIPFLFLCSCRTFKSPSLLAAIISSDDQKKESHRLYPHQYVTVLGKSLDSNTVT